VDIRVDDGPCPVECGESESFGAFLDRLREALFREGRVLASVLIDGEEPTPERWDACQTEPLGRVGSVRIATGSPRSVAASMLKAAREALPPLRAEQERAVEALQAGRRADGLGIFRRCIEMWQAIQESVLLVVDWLDADLALKDEVGDDFVGVTRALAAAVHGLRAALEADDLSALTDAIEADLDPLVERWLATLTALAEGLDAARNGEDQ